MPASSVNSTRGVVGWAAILLPTLHVITDGMEWAQGGFSDLQLWLNYAAFLPMPALMVGLYAMQRPRIGPAGLWGALLYGGSFVYFSHTALFALTESVPDYAALWTRLGGLYSAHGVAMILGGLLFGWATWRSAVFPRLGAGLFVGGLGCNLVIALLPVPELMQIVGSSVRNLGLIVMGRHLISRAP